MIPTPEYDKENENPHTLGGNNDDDRNRGEQTFEFSGVHFANEDTIAPSGDLSLSDVDENEDSSESIHNVSSEEHSVEGGSVSIDRLHLSGLNDSMESDGFAETIAPVSDSPYHAVGNGETGNAETLSGGNELTLEIPAPPGIGTGSPIAGSPGSESGTVRERNASKPSSPEKIVQGKPTKLSSKQPTDGKIASSKTPTGKSSASPSKPKSKSVTSVEGTVIGNYEVLSVLGRGGMGIVYKARHRTLNRIVALKMILHGLHGGSTATERFLAEAQAVASLQHPGIVQIFEIAEHKGLPYFSLEFVEGEDLHSSLMGQPWSPKPAAELIASLCDAMQYAHEHQILHRDIKPANILLDANKRPKLSDFGLAKKLDTGDQVTKDGTVMGTPSYMPPEQARGDAAAISPRSDIYSLGAVLYQLLTGRAPFVSDSMMDTLVQVIHRDPVQPRELQPGVPIDLETICVKALQKEPINRYQSCAELAADLRRYLNGEPILARPISHWERLVRWCKRNPKIAWPTAVAAIFVIATAGVSLFAWRVTAAQALVIAQERDEAKDQRSKAEKERVKADEQRAKADALRIEADKQTLIANEQKALAEENAELATKQANLALQNIQFVVSDIDNELLKQPGSSQIRIAIMEAVSKKWDELDVNLTGGIRGKAVPTLMAARQRIGSTFAQLDRIQEANQEFGKLEKMGRERVVVKAGTDASRLNLAKILMTSSSIQRQIENPAGVEQKLLEAREIVRDVIKNPKPEEVATDANHVQQVLAAINQNLGVDYLRQGRVADTAVVFADAVDANQTVLKNIESQAGFSELPAAKQDAQTLELKIAIDKGVLGLAYVMMRLGKTDEAMIKYDSAIASRRAELQRNPQDLRLKSELGGQLGLYGRSLLWLNRLDAAAPILQEAVKIANEAYKTDPEKTDLKRSFAFALYNEATLCDLQGKKDRAVGFIERCRGLRAELYKASSDEKNGTNLMQAEARIGNIEEAKKLSDKLAETKGPNQEIHLERSCALAQMSRHVDGDEKNKLVDEALTALERSVADGYQDPFRISTDPDLRPLHGEARFVLLVEKLKSAR